ncbi:hypothetical protein QFZ91_005878 [Paraburkholderia sp. JPY419]
MTDAPDGVRERYRTTGVIERLKPHSPTVFEAVR